MKLVLIIISLLLIPNLLAISPSQNGPGCPRCKKVEGEGDLAGIYYFHTENSECENGCSYERDNGECCFCFEPGHYSVTECDYGGGTDGTDATDEICDKAWLNRNQGYRPTSEDQKRIIGGTSVADWKDWPWTASIKIEGKFGCGGVLVSCRHVVTALHCVADDSTGKPVNNSRIKVFFGNVTQFKGTPFTAEEVFYTNMPNKIEFYKNTDILKYDIAVIRLNRDIKPNRKSDKDIRPIMMPTRDLTQHDDYWITGWGYTGYNYVTHTWIETDILHQTDNIPKMDCPTNALHINPDRDLCFDETNVNSTCNGDSGSPGMIEISNRWYLQGIVSRGTSLCNVSHSTGIFMNVFSYKTNITKWINSK